MSDPLGIMRRRQTQPDRPAAKAAKVDPRPEATADLGRPPTNVELALDAGNISARVNAYTEAEAELEGVFANTTVVVNGRRVLLAKLRTQEHVGLLLAEATRELMDTEAHYRAWRARLGLEIVAKAAKGVSEWRVRQIIEADPNYLVYREAIAKATVHVKILETVWETWGDH